MSVANKVDQFVRDSDIAHSIIHGPPGTAVETEGGTVMSLSTAIDSMERVSADVEALKEGQQTSAIYATSWNDVGPITLLGIRPSFAGQGAFVPDSDQGSHQDPVSSLVVANAGQYTAVDAGAGLVWHWIVASGLSAKANLRDLEGRAGRVASVRGDYAMVEVDADFNAAFGIRNDGTTEMVASEVGGYRIAVDGTGRARASGELDVQGVYTEFALDLSTRYPDYLEVDVDQNWNVNRIKFRDGTEWFAQSARHYTAGHFVKDLTVAGVNARITTSAGYGQGKPDTLLLLCHGNGGNYTYQPSLAFRTWAKANKVSFACISQQEAGNLAWGNDVARQRVAALYDYLMANFDLCPRVVLVGQSMGGLVMGQIASYRQIPIRFCLGIGPVPSLSYLFEHGGDNRKVPVRAAYGMASDGSDDLKAAEFFQGYDWSAMGVRMDGQLAKPGFPRTHIYVGSSDQTYITDFGGVVNYPILRDSIRRAGGFCALTTINGAGHADDVLWDRVLADGVFARELGSAN